jgi:hypothetical protein
VHGGRDIVDDGGEGRVGGREAGYDAKTQTEASSKESGGVQGGQHVALTLHITHVKFQV